MIDPIFYGDGYPTLDTVEAIIHWPETDAAGFFDFIRRAWRNDYGSVRVANGWLRFTTGGWSGNEAIAFALVQNPMGSSAYWESSQTLIVERLSLSKYHYHENPRST